MHRFLLVMALASCGGAAKPAPKQLDAPAPVTATATRILGVTPADWEREDGVYEAASRTELELVIAADGTLIETEIEIPVAIVPEAIRAAVTGEIHEAALIVTADGVVYELETADHELRVDAAGNLVGDEVEHDDDEDDDD